MFKLPHWKYLLVTLVLFLGRPFNITNLFFGVRINNYVDTVVFLSDLFILFLWLYQLYQSRRNLVAFKNFFPLVGIFLFNAIVLITTFGFGPHLWNFFIVWFRVISWVWVFNEFAKLNIPKAEQFSGILILLLYSFFDHLLVSSSLPLVIVILILLAIKHNDRLLGRIWLIWFATNFVIALKHVIMGTSFGLAWLGEPILTSNMVNVAVQEIGQLRLLRGYGLTQHPNILGFIGIVGFWALQFLPNFRDFVFSLRRWWYVFYGSSIAIIVLSFSRLALLSGIFILVVSIMIATPAKVGFMWKLVSWSGVILVLATLAFIFANRLSSDAFRVNDIITYLSTYGDITWVMRLFGVGLGGYPFLLQNLYPNMQNWQFQPVHNVWLNLIIELGLIPSLVLLYSSYRLISGRVRSIR